MLVRAVISLVRHCFVDLPSSVTEKEQRFCVKQTNTKSVVQFSSSSRSTLIATASTSTSNRIQVKTTTILPGTASNCDCFFLGLKWSGDHPDTLGVVLLLLLVMAGGVSTSIVECRKASTVLPDFEMEVFS